VENFQGADKLAKVLKKKEGRYVCPNKIRRIGWSRVALWLCLRAGGT
jgi:biotin operon repressor